MKEKLKASTNWNTIKVSQDVLLLLTEIKAITFKFEDQKYIVLSIHNAKVAFYTFRQNELSNSVYLQRFQNLVDIASSMGGNLHDEVISRIVSIRDYSQSDLRDASLDYCWRKE